LQVACEDTNYGWKVGVAGSLRGHKLWLEKSLICFEMSSDRVAFETLQGTKCGVPKVPGFLPPKRKTSVGVECSLRGHKLWLEGGC
jgi:hypothetical protein